MESASRRPSDDSRLATNALSPDMLYDGSANRILSLRAGNSAHAVLLLGADRATREAVVCDPTDPEDPVALKIGRQDSEWDTSFQVTPVRGGFEEFPRGPIWVQGALSARERR